MKYTKEQLKEIQKLLAPMFCNEVPKMIKKHGADAWNKCTAQQLVEFVSVLSDACHFDIDNINEKETPATYNLIDYYQRSIVSINITLLEILVEMTNLKCKEWYELLDAANKYTDGLTNEKLIYSKAMKFRKLFWKTSWYNEPWDIVQNVTDYINEETVDEIIEHVALYKCKGSPKDRKEKAEKLVADRIRKMVDPPTLKELRAVRAEKEKANEIH